MGKTKGRVLDCVFIGDDFTGASDTLATWARAGKQARLFLKPPTEEEIEGLDCVGIASALRSMNPEQADVVLRELIGPLSKLNTRAYHFKICSTFDSSAEIGNIAHACNVLTKSFASKWTAIIGGQPSLGRYCVFGHLFAKASDAKVYRIDEHPVASRHPVTPMTQADLRKHFGKQGWDRIALIDRRQYRDGFEALQNTVQARIEAGETHTLFDVEEMEDLELVGRVIKEVSIQAPPLIIGASSVAEMLNSIDEERCISEVPRFCGPVFAVAGSRSSVTAMQVKKARGYQILVVSPAEFLKDDVAPLVQQCQHILGQGEHLLLQLSAEKIAGVDAAHLADQLAKLVRKVVNDGEPGERQLGCLALAGGDTSSLIVQALDVASLSMITEIDRGVPLVQVHARGQGIDGLPVMLKGGQMGDEDLFNRLIAGT